MHSNEEGERIARLMGDKTIMVMRGHDVTVVGPTAHDAFDETYMAERATLYRMTAMQTGRKLHALPESARRHNTGPGARSRMRGCTSTPGAACWTARSPATRRSGYSPNSARPGIASIRLRV